MVAIFTGTGAGFERGSGSVLGGAGLLGGASLGRSGEQLFLNAATGNLLISQRDEFLVGRGPDAAISRTYNSLGDLSDENGDNWRQSTDRRIYGLTGILNSAGSTVWRVSADGSDILYTWDGAKAAYVATDGAGAYDTLTHSVGVWTWTDGSSRIRETYHAYGAEGDRWRIRQQIDTDQNTLTFNYGINDKLSRVATADGGYVDYVWSGSNITQITTGYTDLATATAKTLTRTRYAYDASNRLSTVTADLSPEDNSVADAKTYVTTYAYDGTSKRVASVTQSDGSKVEFTYALVGSDHRLASVRQWVDAATSRLTQIAYDTVNRITTITDPLGQATRLDYAADGTLRKITAPPAHSGAAAQIVRFTYTASGDLATVTDALGNITSYVYDGSGNILTETDRLGNVVTRTYGAKNELLTETRTGSDGAAAAAQHTTRYVYDVENHLRYVVSAEGRVSEFRYTGAGQLQYTIDYPEHLYNVSALAAAAAPAEAELNAWRDGLVDRSSTKVTVHSYDARGNLTIVTRYGITTAVGGGSTAEGYSSTYFTYDQAGRLLERYALGEVAETFVYDGLGRVVASTDANGGTTRFVFNDAQTRTVVTLASGLVQTSTYNKAGDLIGFTESASTYTTSNLAPHLNASDQWTASGLTVSASGAAYGVTPLRYTVQQSGVVGALRSERAAAAGETITFEITIKADGTKTSHFLGTHGSVSGWGTEAESTATILSGPGSLSQAFGGLWRISDLSTTQETRVRVTRTFAAAEQARTHFYVGESSSAAVAGDSVLLTDPLITKTVANTAPLPVRTASSAYDALGRLRVFTDGTGYKSYFLYDDVGRKVADINHQGDLIEYRYNANGRLVATARYASRITAAQLTTLVDPNSNVEIASIRPVAQAGDLWTFQVYDKEGRVIEAIDGYGRATAYEYDKSGRLVKTTAYGDNVPAYLIEAYKTTPPTGLVVPSGTGAGTSVSRIFYDKDGRLIGALDGEGFLSRIVYDAAGQKIEEIAFHNATGAASRATGTFDQLLATVAAHAGDRITRYVHDGQGQLRYRIDGLNQVTQFNYNNAGRLTTTIAYAGSIAATSDHSFDNVKNLIVASGLLNHAATRKSWTVYDGAGRLAYAIDAENAVTGFTYDAMGQVTKSVRYATKRATSTLPALGTMEVWSAGQDANAANRVTRNYYAASGELRFQIDAEGYVTRKDYDAEGRLTREVRWANAIAVNDDATLSSVKALAVGSYVDTVYAYDPAGRLTDVYDGEGNRRHLDYQANGQLEKEITAYGHATDESVTRFVYDKAGRVIERYDADGTSNAPVTKFAYDMLGNLVGITDPNGNVTTRAYDRLGRMVSQTDALSGIVAYEYNAFDEAVKVTDARGGESYNHYDKLGRLTVSRDAEGYLTETGYTVFGEVASVTRRYNEMTAMASVATVPTVAAHANDATTSFEYDRLGRVVKTTDAEGYYEQYTFDAYGNRLSVRNKLGGIVTNSYDRRGLITSETLPMASVRSDGTTQAATVTNRFEYDARGNRTKRIEAHGLAEQRTTTYVYDKADRLTETRGDPVSILSHTNHSTASTVTPTERIKYDARGNVIETVDALGGRALFYYDKLNRRIAQLSALGTLSTYAYDKNGNVVTSRVYGAAVALPATAGGAAPAAPGGEVRETSYTYDKLNRLKTTSMAGVRTGAWNGTSYATSVGTVTTSFDYDANGNLIQTTDANGGVTRAYYDLMNRKTGQFDQHDYLTKWTYDAEGNVLKERRYRTGLTPNTLHSVYYKTPTGHADDRITNFTYDRNGRRVSEQRTSVVAWTVDANGVLAAASSPVISYAYNGLGQVTRKTEATGDVVDYAYDNSGRLTTETRAAFWDQNGALVRPTVRYSYDGLNNLTMTRQGGEAAAAGDRFTRYGYGADGRLATMTDAAGAVYSYAYDAAGNVVRESYSRVKSDGSSVQEGILYARDLLGRVTSQALGAWNGTAWAKGDSQDMAYNAYGEVSQRGVNGGWQEQFAYDTAGRLWRTNSGDGVWRFFVYDASGNQTLTLESEGLDLAGKTIDQVLSTATAGGTSTVGATYVDHINATINVYDKRGQAVETRLPKRQLSLGTAVVDLAVSRGYNAFGEVAYEIDAKGNQTTYLYNTMGRNVSIRRPTVSITLESGAVQSATPTDLFFYDVSGRLVGIEDANGNRTTRALLAGTGYGGSEAQVTFEYHADGGILRTDYDAFGDARKSWDEAGRLTDMSYDAMGRLVQANRANGLVDSYAYDLLGQRIKHWNSLLGIANVETTDYDLQGRVVRQVAFGGDVTTTGYAWSSALVTSGLGTFGGWTQTTTYANGKTLIEQSDLFGRDLSKTDLGGRVFAFTYDKAGRMIQRSGGETLAYAYLNTGLVGSVSSESGTLGGLGDYELLKTAYGYDANGNKVSERYTKEGGYWYSPPPPIDPYSPYREVTYLEEPYYSEPEYITYSYVYQNATAAYDALGRLTSWTETGSGTAPAAKINYEYDAVGNVRRTRAEYRALSATGAAAATASVQDYWYRYDAMNRVVTAKGSLSGGQIVRGYAGADYLYDKAGQRVRATRTIQSTAYVHDPYYNPYYYPYGSSSGGYMLVYYDAESREDYTYDLGGGVSTVRVAQSGYYESGYGTVTVTAPPATGALKGSYWYDAMGRLTRQIDWTGDGTGAGYDRYIVYNAKGQISSETVVTKQGTDTWTSYVTNAYGSGTTYALGAATSVSTSDYKNGTYQFATTTTNTYVWYDGAVQSRMTFAKTNQTTYNTYYYYDGAGVLGSVQVSDGRPRKITFLNDMTGQAIRRDESDNNGSAGDPHEIWYRFNGRQLGYTGNNGTLDTDYQSSIANRTRAPSTPATPGAFRFGATSGSAYADFDLSLDPINSYAQGGSGGSYTVRAGDTLAGIASSLWGDASLWYKLAETNGMSGAGALSEGQRLTIPAGVMKSQHNAGTFKPYDPAEVLGDTSPTTPQPQKATAKKNKCGVFGAVLLVVVAVAVTVVTAGAAAAIAAPGLTLGQGITVALGGSAMLGGAAVSATTVGLAAFGAIGAAAGSIASQGFGVATGIQDKFSWKGVAMAALGGGIGGGLGAAFPGGGVLGAAARGAAGSALTQGIGIVTGLQKKFDWAGVAAAGVISGVGHFVGGKLGAKPFTEDNSLANHLRHTAASTAGAIAGAAARSLATGTSFGDNILAALPDVIGSTIGNAIANSFLPKPEIEDIIVFGDADSAEAQQTAPGTPEGDASIPREDLEFWNRNDLGTLRLDRDDKVWERDRLRGQRQTEGRIRQIARLDAEITQMNDVISQLNAIHLSLVRHGVGKTVQVNDEYYEIRGPGARFDSARDTAKDGIALSFYIASITNDPFERGASITRLSRGGYTYRELVVGTTTTRARDVTVRVNGVLQRRRLEENQPFLPISTTNTVAVFHIHPRSRSSGDTSIGARQLTHNSLNIDFSEGDIDVFSSISQQNRNVEFFLGGSDGSFDRMFRNNRNRVDSEQLGSSGYFQTARTRRIY